MKRKIKLLIICIFGLFLTGCKATYNATIEGDNISEEIMLDNLPLTNEQLSLYVKYPIPVDINNGCFLDYDNLENFDDKKVDGISYYQVIQEENSSLKANTKIPIDEYGTDRIANSLFNKFNVNNYDDILSIYGYNGLVAFTTYLDLEEVDISLKVVDRKVLSHNATQVKDNVYTWHFTRDMDNSQTLYIEMDNSNLKDNNSNKFYSGYIIIAIIIVLLITGILVKIVTDRKEKKHIKR